MLTNPLEPDKLDIVFTAPYDTAGTPSLHPDILGYLGFPESGMIQLTDDAGNSGDQGYNYSLYESFSL